MSNIFKIYINNNINNNNSLTNLYLFIKNKYISNNLKETVQSLQSKYTNSKEFINSDIFNDVFINDFSKLDIKFINDFNIDIYFIDDNIYYDDTLENIKFKFIKYYNNLHKSKQISYEEIYMYGIINKKYNSVEIFNNLSNNNSNKISNENIKNYLLNINEQIEIFNKLLELNDNKEKDYYTFNDIDSIKLEEINILKPIGQNINTKLPHLYTTNPFQVNKYSNYIQSIINTSLNTNNHNLIFEYNIVNNCLFFCLFDDVLNYINKSSINLEEDITIKLYFPLISSNYINSKTEFNNQKTYLLNKTNQYILSKNFIDRNNFINQLNTIKYNTNNYKQLTYNIDGIKTIHFNLHTKINHTLSLETLFKLFNCIKLLILYFLRELK